MKRCVWAAVLALGVAGCGGSHVAATIPAAVVGANRCPDWVNDPSDGVTWEANENDDEIQTFIGEVPDSAYVAFKGAGPIDAPIGKVANVLIDTPRHHEWVPHFGGMRIVRHISETEKVIYRHVTTPFIISDRDFVVKARMSKDAGSGHLLLDFSSVRDPDAPEREGKVRGVLHSSGYRMWPIDGGARTMVIFTIHVDPMGDVPAWIVNLFQAGYARTNLQNIRQQAVKHDVAEHPRVKEEFRDYQPSCGN
ncbi:MAG: hypothetical protein DRI90_06565 [Deltaproteobacteria bacterium]|nr:MAG: hypothetical protein DRI90_06565 [Deltaproteobacteria bacterium]